MNSFRLRALVGPAAIGLAVVTTGCSQPRFLGPQVQAPPPGFTINVEAKQDSPMFPSRAVVFHTAWVEASWGNFSGIYVNGHPGVLGRSEVEGAHRDAMAKAAGRRVEFGELEQIQIDERTAWGWGETWRLENGGLQYVVFRAAVPYDTITYAVDILTGDPGLKIRPDSLRTVAASFEIGRVEWNFPLLLIMAGALVFMIGSWSRKQKARAAQARHVPLVKIPSKLDQETAVPPTPKPTPTATPSKPDAPPASSSGTDVEAPPADAPPPKAPPPKAPTSIADAIKKDLGE